MKWIRKLYFGKPLLARFLFGVDPDQLTYADVKREVLKLRLFMWLWVLVTILVFFGVSQMHGEIVSCMSGKPLQACYEVLASCQGQGFIPAGVNLTLPV